MLVKQWLIAYLAMDWISPEEQLRARQYRRLGLKNWRVLQLAAGLPLLFHVSLGLFFPACASTQPLPTSSSGARPPPWSPVGRSSPSSPSLPRSSPPGAHTRPRFSRQRCASDATVYPPAYAGGAYW
ncbi:hypothetical protein PsYK624_115730 [Phanerochaete sordida]|uniref:DUF6535 domain-containing protein n=1 Tax=Phanerochaete sordida TaxID=48140 RepID=A0A9P3GKY8_9APHY|nr:hypothetical protein PsYK624_115730 [Phanerochaete sordida]